MEVKEWKFIVCGSVTSQSLRGMFKDSSLHVINFYHCWLLNFLKLPVNLSTGVQNHAQIAKHISHNPKEHGGWDPSVGYLRKREGLFSTTAKKRTNIKAKFGASNFERLALNLAAILWSCFIQMSRIVVGIVLQKEKLSKRKDLIA